MIAQLLGPLLSIPLSIPEGLQASAMSNVQSQTAGSSDIQLRTRLQPPTMLATQPLVTPSQAASCLAVPSDSPAAMPLCTTCRRMQALVSVQGCAAGWL